MKYKYYDTQGRLIAQSDSKIAFNEKLFPTWTKIEPKVESSGFKKTTKTEEK